MLAVGSLVRLSYALGLLVVPDLMSARRLAPEHSSAYGRMTTRAVGAVHTNVSLLSLRAAGLDRCVRLALALNIGCDLGDLIATFLEWHNGDLPVAAVVGSAVVQSTGIATWSALLRAV
jgi:hypothetical protein